VRSTDCGPPGLPSIHLHVKRMTCVVRCKVDDEQYKKGNEEQQESLLKSKKYKRLIKYMKIKCCLPEVSPKTPVVLYIVWPTLSFHAVVSSAPILLGRP